MLKDGLLSIRKGDCILHGMHVISGNAAWKAAQKMRKRLIKEAAEYLEVNENSVEFDGKTFISGEKSVTLNDLSIRNVK